MKKITLVVFICLVISLLGCLSRTDIVISENRHFPKKPAFQIMPEGSYEGTNLDFNAIYYMRHEMVVKNVSYVSYDYYRFWPNGRVLKKATPQLPTIEVAENFSNARLGYYQVSDQEITMELFFPDSVILNWDYILVFAQIKKDCIIRTETEIRGEVDSHSDIFWKHSLGVLKRQPDW